MSHRTARTLQCLRIGSQAAFLALFIFFFLRAGTPLLPSWASRGMYFAIDPLLLILNFAAVGRILTFALLAFIPLALTLILGRFFCGWVCPLGAIHQFFTWSFKKSRKEKKEPSRRFLRLKYLILLAVIVSTIVGANLGGWLDPFALLTRSAAGAVDPSIRYLAYRASRVVPKDYEPEERGSSQAYDLAKSGLSTGWRRASVQPVLIGTLFLGLIGLNAFKKRFFCNVLCPLGAIYGLEARFSLLGLKSQADCVSCEACAEDCPYGGGPGQENYLKSECLVCFNCAVACPAGAVSIRWAGPKKSPQKSIDLGRRRAIGAAVFGLAAAALPKSALEAQPGRSHRFLRPPGSVKETEFLSRCARCGQCLQACPTGFIQLALLEAGVEGLWTPVLNARAGYCEYECRRCTQVCPSGAIEELMLEQKKRFKIGTAVIDKNWCYTYADGINCTICEERCPLPEKAIRFREEEVRDYRGQRVSIRQVYVVPALCTGCGICEHVCPRGGAPGIVITAEEEERESVGY